MDFISYDFCEAVADLFSSFVGINKAERSDMYQLSQLGNCGFARAATIHYTTDQIWNVDVFPAGPDSDDVVIDVSTISGSPVPENFRPTVYDRCFQVTFSDCCSDLRPTMTLREFFCKLVMKMKPQKVHFDSDVTYGMQLHRKKRFYKEVLELFNEFRLPVLKIKISAYPPLENDKARTSIATLERFFRIQAELHRTESLNFVATIWHSYFLNADLLGELIVQPTITQCMLPMIIIKAKYVKLFVEGWLRHPRQLQEFLFESQCSEETILSSGMRKCAKNENAFFVQHPTARLRLFVVKNKDQISFRACWFRV